jgi:hypothetical protein
MYKGARQDHREKIRAEFWPAEIAWTGDRPEVGWFRAPRSLPLILMLLASKKISGKTNPMSVYLELLARHRDTGIVEMSTEADHSYAAGYSGPRGVRTWQERMKLLERLGFIKSIAGGNQTYKYVVLIHPAIAIKKLESDGKVDRKWWNTYRQAQIDSKESTYEQVLARIQSSPSAAPSQRKKKKSQKKQD